ncbi:hypothetical protein EON82_04680 [bacterium]|nr:MAG: hypothetical protein EON82_04680 [bacterium]
MMRAKADPKATTTSLYGLAALLLAGSLLGLVWPKPTARDAYTKETTETRKLRQSIRQAELDTTVSKAAVLSRTWTEEPATIQDKVLTLTAALSKKRGVTFVRLQPQRIATEESMEQLPFLLVVEGPFPAVAALEKDLELPANRLAINLFQVTSADSESNKVAASISIVAHRLLPSVEKKETNGKRSNNP